MALEAEIPVREFTGNGVATAFDHAPEFTLSDPSHLVVWLDGAVIGTGFVKTATGIEFDEAPADGVSIVLQRVTPLEQPLTVAGLRVFSLEGITNGFDRLVRCLQEHLYRFLRTIRVPDGETLDELPAAANRKGKVPYFNATTGALELLTPDQFLSLTTPFFEIAIGTVTHVAAGGTPTATLTGTYPTFVLNLGIVTGATGSIDGGPDCGFGTLPNENGGQDFALIDNTDGVTLVRYRSENGVPVSLAPVP